VSPGGWHVRAQFWAPLLRATRSRWLDFGPMTYARALDEGRRHVREGRNARLVDPDGIEGPLITLPATSPATPPEKRVQLELALFPTE
jgi:hypothetical protein